MGQGHFAAVTCVLWEQGKMRVQIAAGLEGVTPAWPLSLCPLWYSPPCPVPGVLREDYIVGIPLPSLSPQSGDVLCEGGVVTSCFSLVPLASFLLAILGLRGTSPLPVSLPVTLPASQPSLASLLCPFFRRLC